MKKILHILLFSLAPVLVFAQPSPPSPAAATQAEVNAGVVPNKYVSPKTLAGWTGGGGGGGGTPGGASGDWQKNVAGSFGGVTPTSGWDTLFGAPSSANLYAWMSDETGSGVGALLVFNSSPTIASPTLTGTTTTTTINTTTLNATTLSWATSLASDDTYAGEVLTGFNNSGGVTQWDAVYLNSSGAWVIADANGSGTYPARGLAIATASTGNATTVVVRGTIRNDGWSAWTVGAPIYLSGTAGAITQTVPATSGDKVQVIGYAIASKTIFVDFNSTYVTVQ